jgi:hypothetical protein
MADCTHPVHVMTTGGNPRVTICPHCAKPIPKPDDPPAPPKLRLVK